MDSDYHLGLLASVFTGSTVITPSADVIVAFIFAALLVIVSAFISASESAFMALSPDEIKAIRACNSRKDARLAAMLDDAESLQATIMLSNNFVNVMVVLLCNYAFGRMFDFSSPVLQFVLVAALVFFLLLLFAEVLPKIYSVSNPLGLLRMASPMMTVLDKAFSPLVWVYVKATSSFDRAFAARKHGFSVDELSHALELTDKREISEENNILKGIVKFGEESVREVMTPRLDMVDIGIDATYDELLKCVVDNVYSRIPVYEGTRDNIRGIIYIKDLLPYLDREGTFEWQTLVRPPFFVPETKKIDDLLTEFRNNKVHIAIVVDEFGGTSGLITMEDIIEEIVGDIQDEYDDDEKLYVKLNDTTYIFEAKMLLTDFYKVIGSEPADVEELAGDSDTLAGLLLEIKGEFPALHEHITVGIYDFEILNVDRRRILKVKLTINEKA